MKILNKCIKNYVQLFICTLSLFIALRRYDAIRGDKTLLIRQILYK